MTEETAVAAEETVTATKTKSKAKNKGTGDVILDVAAEIENLQKAQVLSQADRLVEDIEGNYFRLGGLLTVINDQGWYEGYESLAHFVKSKYGFEERKARYLMDIYTNLVKNQIPWEKVGHLGWTKLKELAKHLTLDNVDEWVAKAEACTVLELKAMLKGAGASEEKESTTTDSTTLKFKCHADQVETIQSALSKIKAETGTPHDNVALEHMAAGVLSGSIPTAKVDPTDLTSIFTNMGIEAVLGVFEKAFPTMTLTLDTAPVAEEAAPQEAQA